MCVFCCTLVFILKRCLLIIGSWDFYTEYFILGASCMKSFGLLAPDWTPVWCVTDVGYIPPSSVWFISFNISCSVVWDPACSGERPFDRSAEVTLWHPRSGPLPVLRRLLPASHPHRPLPGRRELGEAQDHLHEVWVFRVQFKPGSHVCKGRKWKVRLLKLFSLHFNQLASSITYWCDQFLNQF